METVSSSSTLGMKEDWVTLGQALMSSLGDKPVSQFMLQPMDQTQIDPTLSPQKTALPQTDGKH